MFAIRHLHTLPLQKNVMGEQIIKTVRIQHGNLFLLRRQQKTDEAEYEYEDEDESDNCNNDMSSDS